MGERFGKGGIADRSIWFNGYPFLDNKEEHSFGVPVSHVMTSNAVSLPAVGLEFRALERIMRETEYRGYPIVEDTSSKTLVGYIGRTELRYAIDRVKKEHRTPGHAKCYFASASTALPTTTPASTMPAVTFDTMSATTDLQVDFSPFTDHTPLSVHPRLPLETAMEIFKKMGPRVILVEYRGRLVGLVTAKDCLKYQFKVEAHEMPSHASPGMDERQERVWGAIRCVALWVDQRLDWWRRMLGLSQAVEMRDARAASREVDRGRAVELEDRRRGSSGH